MARSVPEIGESLKDVNPELADQIRGVDATLVKPFSNQSVSWICIEGHSWEARISERSKGLGCPFCSNQRVLPGFNDLATTVPALATQASGWDPSTVTKGSNKRRDWLCSEGHLFTSSVKDRMRSPNEFRSCPICAGREVLVGYNDLATTHPEIAKQADGWDASSVTKHSTQKAPWRCADDHCWKMGPNIRVKGTGCPVCSNQTTVAGQNDMATTHPYLAAQADGWDPTTLVAGSNKMLAWKCELNHEWKAQASTRLRGDGCPYCGNRRVQPGFNDLLTTHPDLAAQAVGWDPTTVTFGSNKERAWKCEIGHSYSTSITKRRKGDGCPYCSGRQCLPGFNDLKTTNPKLALEAFEWDPTTVSSGSSQKMKWLCQVGHVYISPVSRRSGGAGCTFCSNRKVLPGFNDLLKTHPLLALEADGWNPASIIAGNNKRMNWQCKEGHKWTATVNSRSSGGKGCPYCSGNSLLVGINDFATVNRSLLSEVDGWDPTSISAFSDKKAKFKCEYGHSWTTSVKYRSIGRGCPSCAKSGFDPNKKAWFYFLENDFLDLFQIGITNDIKRRLAKHHSGGWTEIEVRGPMEGGLTRDLETEVLRSLKRRGAVFANTTELKRFDGWSEAWSSQSLTVTTIKELLDFVYEDDELHK